MPLFDSPVSPIPQSLVLDLPLADDAVDRSGYGHDGTLSGAAEFDDGALVCDGTPGSGVVVAHRPHLILPPPWTVSCSVQILAESIGPLHSLVALDVAAEWAAPFCQVWLVVQQDGKPSLAAGGDLAITADTVVADANWHHLAAVYTGRRLQLYVDGVLQAAADWQGEYVASVQSLLLGHHPSTLQNLVGRIVNVKVRRVALQASAVAALAAADMLPGA